jgi:acyl-CoA thioesterase YciA
MLVGVLPMDSRVPVIRATAMPTHLNPYGGVFGGWIISQMALGAGSEASRKVRGKAVLVAADELRFKGAPKVGDEVSAAVAVSRERHGEGETRVAWGRFKFVALDEDDRPREIAAKEETDG